MSSFNDKKYREMNCTIRDLLLLPSMGLKENDFYLKEEKLRNIMDQLSLDPYWSDYLYFPSKNGLPDCMIESGEGEFEINDVAIKIIIEKILSYKPIQL